MRVLITGGAGFIGSHLCRRWLREGATVTLLDDLSRPGSAANAELLRQQAPPGRLVLHAADVCRPAAVAAALANQEAVFHLAAQVAVTRSVRDPLTDFAVNATGTLNLLEAARAQPQPPFFLFTSTNKVYGSLAGRAGEAAIAEDQPLDFHSPYGCSKGSADQYVRDYARIFGLPTVVFRMSCIYGPGQNGDEDQGWVAHFARAQHHDQAITIYGDGHQQRDLLYVDDLIEAMLAAWRRRERTAGAVFNVGGGGDRVRSLRQIVAALERRWARPARLGFAPPRPGDQRRFCSDFGRLQALTGWAPRVGVADGLERLCAWLAAEPAACESRAA